jgi:hypothetical protein
MLWAENDKAALEEFSKKVSSGDVTENEGAGFENPDILFLTYEEVDRDATTKVNIGKTSAGIQVGITGIAAGSGNT